ncbi:conserved hypothetical protein [Histoplasma capsulatum G186AR]|uniref:Uncharacterized protein n=1 Tax=Ajellomyces capsulatus (strain G186AR / H82 / ATCC MYA-2454 / RMSCC 2432) TaxID=447093 RepID=C0NUR4_AJECG|nr:uncharacterized protein HCBG_06678 [Histoplasma capsulatum G186AR]EEH04727.1 conserved hypothetical protein [Histoplasma capsulatum G186AR]
MSLWGKTTKLNIRSISNNHLLHLYNFVILSNPNDNYELILETHSRCHFLS